MNFKDFDIIKFIGKGAFGKVFVVRKTGTVELYAMKVIPKSLLKTEYSLNSILTERAILMKSNHPFIVKLRYAFQNGKYVAFVMDYMRGGALSTHLKNQVNQRFDEETARYYASQVLLALENMHDTLKAVYRDLKPQNILVDENGNLKITDFGLSKSKIISWEEILSDRLWNS
jgi:serum/glucocorticoid-regulated kinase 2